MYWQHVASSASLLDQFICKKSLVRRKGSPVACRVFGTSLAQTTLQQGLLALCCTLSGLAPSLCCLLLCFRSARRHSAAQTNLQQDLLALCCKLSGLAPSPCCLMLRAGPAECHTACTDLCAAGTAGSEPASPGCR